MSGKKKKDIFEQHEALLGGLEDVDDADVFGFGESEFDGAFGPTADPLFAGSASSAGFGGWGEPTGEEAKQPPAQPEKKKKKTRPPTKIQDDDADFEPPGQGFNPASDQQQEQAGLASSVEALELMKESVDPLVALIREGAKQTARSTELIRQTTLRYRRLLGDKVKQLGKQLHAKAGGEGGEGEKLALFKAFRDAHALWHLMELLCINPSTTTADLCGWLQTHYDGELLEEASGWRQLKRCLVYGRTEKARELLNGMPMGERSTTATRRLIDALLKAMPHPSPPSPGFRAEWNQWHRDCLSFQENQDVRRDPELKRLVELLAGDFGALSECCNQWQELMVGLLTFSQPAQLLLQVKPAALRAAKDKPPAASMSSASAGFVDGLLLDLIGSRQNVLHLLVRLQSLPLLGHWLAAHMATIMSLSGLLKRGDHEPLLLTYCGDLAAAPASDGLWDASMRCYELLPDSTTRNDLHRLVPHALGLLNLDSSDQHPSAAVQRVEELLRVSRRFRLDPAVDRQLQTALATAFSRHGVWASALHWYHRAGEDEEVAVICNRMLDALFLPSSSSDAVDIPFVRQLIDDYFSLQFYPTSSSALPFSSPSFSSSSSAASNEATTPRMVEFLRLLCSLIPLTTSALHAPEFAAGVARCLLDELAPRRLWLWLLYRLAPLLKLPRFPFSTPAVQLSGDTVHRLLHCVQLCHYQSLPLGFALTLSPSPSSSSPASRHLGISDQDLPVVIREIRLSLCTYLANSLVHTNSHFIPFH
ncbi:MAG: hypothetical protein Q8P67_08220 [archaeon]|nr:hypothetical protein [archaeon]